MDKTGQFLLHFPVVEAGEVVMGPLDAIAKCKEGTAAWTAFQTSRILSSQQPEMRYLDHPPLLTPYSVHIGCAHSPAFPREPSLY